MISKASSPVTLAHELGHALGLLDCFDAAGNGRGTPMLGRGECISKVCFASATRKRTWVLFFPGSTGGNWCPDAYVWF